MMKKLISVTLILALILSLTACAAADKAAESSPADSAPETSTAAGAPADGDPSAVPTTPDTTAALPEPTAQAPETSFEASDTTAQAPETLPAEPEGTRILVVYFSSANTVDAVSAATPYFDGTASTAVLADLIAEQTDADLAKITPTADYPEGYNDTADKAKQEQNSGARPAFLPLDVNPEDYDVIFIGYPVWWYTLPMILYTFFDTYDFTGKTLVPFNTHEGSRDGGTWDTIAQLEPGATVLDGFAVRGGSAADDSTREKLIAWAAGLGLE